jgi:hypothetical protein
MATKKNAEISSQAANNLVYCNPENTTRARPVRPSPLCGVKCASDLVAASLAVLYRSIAFCWLYAPSSLTHWLKQPFVLNRLQQDLPLDVRCK